ncbi:uncharacterized protein LOC108165167 isoform X2 [Drosophila miranda]|uniref:uncharacterized protein LOC108165167 isoform X2 n=1 Tax=Drosophila miranda TaxID=7229 RepID=UPI00143F2B2E|nr:uncharacterized protein LOC108165167 isoform X2 [Drosophila miranda]
MVSKLAVTADLIPFADHMIRALLSLWSPSAVSVSTEDEAQNQNLAQAQSARQIRARWGIRRQSRSGNVYPRFRHFSRHPRMIAFEMAVRQNLANLLDRVEPNFHQPQAEQDPDLSESEPDEGFFLQRYGGGYAVIRRRCNFTLPRIGIDEPVSQPLVWLALETLEAEAFNVNDIQGTRSSADFVAQFLVKNLTIDVFNAGNQPGYGPSNVRPPPPPPPPAVN